MQISNGSPLPLPYKLKRPFFVFFKAFSIAYLLAAMMAFWFGHDAFLLTVLIGGAMWFGLGMGVVCNWQALTLFDDYLVFTSFGKRHPVFYKDIQEVEGYLTVGVRARTLSIYLHHTGLGKTPVQINPHLFATSDRTILLNYIKEAAPNARWNEQAEKVRSSRSKFI